MNKKEKQAMELAGAVILIAIVAAIIDATLSSEAPTKDYEEEAMTAEPLSQTI